LLLPLLLLLLLFFLLVLEEEQGAAAVVVLLLPSSSKKAGVLVRFETIILRLMASVEVKVVPKSKLYLVMGFSSALGCTGSTKVNSSAMVNLHSETKF